MHIVATNDFTRAVEPAFALLTDPDFLDAVCRATHPLEHSVAVSGLTTGSRRVMENHPSIRRFTGPTITVTDEITWDAEPTDGTRHGRARVAVEGMPVELLGTVALEPRGTGSRLTYSGELTVGIPLLGPSLERQAAPLLVEALSRQEQVAQTWPAG
ncbi:MAG TPA: DUF2505 domain-containing protein [Propionicimonas sp.]|jgi:hypothetical protein|nr:DUF2505 domain-containing protein [Propionicimonas sp.]